jgi:hypothetical protein
VGQAVEDVGLLLLQLEGELRHGSLSRLPGQPQIDRPRLNRSEFLEGSGIEIK